MNEKPYLSNIIDETQQTHQTRVNLFKEIEKIIDRPVLSFFTSFNHPVMMEDIDASMIEGFLKGMDLKKGLCLIVNSPGGIGLTAERIISICRSYSDTGDYWVIVPNKAKSAATMVCFGASKIIMGPTSELGPIDPQVTLFENNIPKRFSVCNIVQSYEDLFKKAVETKGNLQPYLQQLNHYDNREIMSYKDAIALSEDIAIRALRSGMMSSIKKDNEIKKKIEIFLTPKYTKSHGRPIYYKEAEACGLKIQQIAKKEKLWNFVCELSVRTDMLVSNKLSKCIETVDYSFSLPAPKGDE